MPTYSNIYTNLAKVVPVTILSGQSSTPLIDSTLVAESGCAALRRITLPANFPSNRTLIFGAVERPTDTDFAFLKISDGINKNLVQILSTGGPELETISLPAIIFDSIQFFRMQIDNPMTEDVIIRFIFEPIYQG